MQQNFDFLQGLQQRKVLLRKKLYALHEHLSVITTKDVKQILIFNAPSRSGSSLLYNLLSHEENFYSLNGEAVPFYKLNIVNTHMYTYGDALSEQDVKSNCNLVKLSQDFIADLFIKSKPTDILINERDRETYFVDLAARLILQWPNIEFDDETLLAEINLAFQQYLTVYDYFKVDLFYITLLKILCSNYPTINPYYYDIDYSLIAQAFPSKICPIGPPNDYLTVEEPPFILLHPAKHIAQETINNKVLLLKTSVDIYRMSLIKQLFPNARIKIVCLFRNPAGSINGLYDGWCHQGFFSYNLKNIPQAQAYNNFELKISGYSDRFDFGKYWWNFDLPPGWLNYTEKTLQEVCAFQWYVAVIQIITTMDECKNDCCIIKYENIVQGYTLRAMEITKIFNFINQQPSIQFKLRMQTLPIIQATKKPKCFRWKGREQIIFSALTHEILNIADHVGYNKYSVQEWL